MAPLNSKVLMRIEFLLLPVVVALCTADLHAQDRAAIVGWVGGAGGSPTAGHAVVGGSVQVPLTDRFAATGDVAYITKTPGACADAWPGSYRCSFHGTAATAGIGVEFLRWKSLSAAAVVTGGFFLHTDSTFETTEPTVGLGGHATLRLGGPFLLQARYRFYEIFDENVEDLLGEKPSLHAVTFGIGIVL
jgi:hypothetical protein